MKLSFAIAISIQVMLIVWLLRSLHIRREDFHFLDDRSTMALKGYFSILIVLFHVPVSSVLYNLLGCVSFVVIVTLFSFFYLWDDSEI